MWPLCLHKWTFTPFNETKTRKLGGPDRYAYHGFDYEEGTRRLTRATFDRDASINNVADLRYAYDPAGNVLSIADVPADLPANHELQCFQYDPQRRLVEAWAQADISGAHPHRVPACSAGQHRTGTRTPTT